jgi:hypothetical protein
VLPVQTNSRVFMRGKNQTSDGVASWSPVNADVGAGKILSGSTPTATGRRGVQC